MLNLPKKQQDLIVACGETPDRRISESAMLRRVGFKNREELRRIRGYLIDRGYLLPADPEVDGTSFRLSEDGQKAYDEIADTHVLPEPDAAKHAGLKNPVCISLTDREHEQGKARASACHESFSAYVGRLIRLEAQQAAEEARQKALRLAASEAPDIISTDGAWRWDGVAWQPYKAPEPEATTSIWDGIMTPEQRAELGLVK